MTQLAIKSLSKFSPRPTSVSALPEESKPSIIRVKMNEKNVNKFHLSRSVGSSAGLC